MVYLIADMDLSCACLQFGSRSRIPLIVMPICVFMCIQQQQKMRANDKKCDGRLVKELQRIQRTTVFPNRKLLYCAIFAVGK